MCRSQSMNWKFILAVFILPGLLLGCAVSGATPPLGTTTAPTACPTKTTVAQATSTPKESNVNTVESSSGSAPTGQAGQVGPGAGSETPSPEQIATSRAMTDESNRNGPLPDQTVTEIPADTQPSGPGVSAPDASGSPPATTVSENPSPTGSSTPYLSEQPYPGGPTVAHPCP